MKRFGIHKIDGTTPRKSTIVGFRTEDGMEKKEQWNWKDQTIEQVKEVKYLGYQFKKIYSKKEKNKNNNGKESSEI